MVFEKAIMTPPFRPPSNFPDEACFLYVIEGGQRTLSPTEKIELRAKDAVLLKCGTYFTEWISGFDYEKCEAIGVHLYPEVLKRIYENEIPEFLAVEANRNTTNLYKVVNNDLVHAYIQSMLFYFENPQIVDEALLKLKLKELILLLMKTEKSDSISQILSSLFSPKTYKLKEIIQAHLYSNLTIDELATFANLSVSTFKREFEKAFNDSPARYLKSKKIERSLELLTKTNERISEIAFACGFADIAHFSNSFTEKLGVSPSEYRLNQKPNSLD